ncbi:MAG: hypothetical protein WA869_11835, partial [Alloacidobacterium sp.]
MPRGMASLTYGNDTHTDGDPPRQRRGRGEEESSSHGARPDHRGQRLDDACATTPIFSNIDEPAGGYWALWT